MRWRAARHCKAIYTLSQASNFRFTQLAEIRDDDQLVGVGPLPDLQWTGSRLAVGGIAQEFSSFDLLSRGKIDTFPGYVVSQSNSPFVVVPFLWGE